MILCTFMETFIDVFIYCFPKKIEKLNRIYTLGLKFGSFFKLYGWGRSAMKNIQYAIPFS